jgi:hypothetical protein
LKFVVFLALITSKKEKSKVRPVLLIKYHAVKTYKDVGVEFNAVLTTFWR